MLGMGVRAMRYFSVVCLNFSSFFVRHISGIAMRCNFLMFEQVGQIPALDNLLAKNPYLPFKFPDFSSAAAFCVERFVERMQHMEEYKDKKDFMNGFLQAKHDYPNEVTDNEVIGYLIINVRSAPRPFKTIPYHPLCSRPPVTNAPNDRFSPAQTRQA